MANEKTKEEIKLYNILKTCNLESKGFIEEYTLYNEILNRICNKIRELDKEREEIYNEIRELDKEREEIYNEIRQLRTKEVVNVLMYLKYYKENLKPNEIDSYLCHCLNKLIGKIDGTFLTFRDPTKDNKNEN